MMNAEDDRMQKVEDTLSKAAVERWLFILRAIAHHPGLSPDQLRMAVEEGLGRPCGASTLYRDLAYLKTTGLLSQGRHRQGYFLAGPSASQDEMQVLLNGLRIEAEDLGNPLARDLYDKLIAREARTRPEEARLSYPVESIANSPVMKTTREDFQDVMAYLREPIQRGQQVCIRLTRNPWAPEKAYQEFRLFPLQFIFHDVAWYLLAEGVNDHQFQVIRIDRVHPALEILDAPERGSIVQLERLKLARNLLRMSWSMAMPPHDAQGQFSGELEEFSLRFSKQAAGFIQENHRRHDTQQLHPQADGSLVFTVRLPLNCSADFHLRRWVLSWGRSVEVLAPTWFRQRISDEVAEIGELYAAEHSAVSTLP